jgi:polysaccharide export outer membrane protein
MRSYKCLLLLLFAAFNSLSMSGQTPLAQRVTDTTLQQTSPSGVNGFPEVNMSTTVTGTHAILGTGDLLGVGVFGVPDLNQRVRVDNDGVIHLALIGDIAVTGKSAEWVRNQIAEKLVDGHYVKNPQVELYVIEYSGQMAYITGEINRPGAYSLLRSHRLTDLIATAGGLTPKAGTAITINHNGDTKNAIHVDLNDKDDSHSNPEIEPGDTIDVGMTGIVYVLGNVGHPGGFLLDRRTTLSFMKAIALAEGPTPSGSITKAVLIHSSEPNSQPVPVNLKMILKARDPDIQLVAGDIIWVGDSATRNLGRLALETIMATASGVAIYSSYSR